eukprot:COSAG01_NODE_24100_length_790_cov_1.444284_1_plen_188_part_10
MVRSDAEVEEVLELDEEELIQLIAEAEAGGAHVGVLGRRRIVADARAARRRRSDRQAGAGDADERGAQRPSLPRRVRFAEEEEEQVADVAVDRPERGGREASPTTEDATGRGVAPGNRPVAEAEVAQPARPEARDVEQEDDDEDEEQEKMAAPDSLDPPSGEADTGGSFDRMDALEQIRRIMAEESES